jgi:uncharacterized protein
MIRAVLDANVFISGIVSEGGVPGTILKAWHEEQFELVTSTRILDEFRRVLRYPKITKRHQWSTQRIEAYLEDLAALSILTPGKLTLSIVKEDPSDNRYLECAIEGEADCIVTGHGHLLALEEFQGIEILPPRAFLARLA